VIPNDGRDFQPVDYHLEALMTLGEFLVVILLGMVAALLIIMPCYSALALISWFTGVLIWLTINNLYSASLLFPSL
jgi:hypothetical protein